jgi:hypothetical protein
MLSTSEGFARDGGSNACGRCSDVCDTTDAMCHESSHGEILFSLFMRLRRTFSQRLSIKGETTDFIDFEVIQIT